MTLDELIEQLEEIRKETGGDIDVYYLGYNSPVNKASVYVGSRGVNVELG